MNVFLFYFCIFYNYHIQERPTLRLRGRYFSDVDVRQRATTSRLLHLKSCIFQDRYSALLSAFVEKWQPYTNSFHMLFDEITITLHDVEHIPGMPVCGDTIYHRDTTGTAHRFSEP